MARRQRNTILFIGFLLTAGCANVLSMVFGPGPASLMTALNYVILTGLLLFWILSVLRRLLPSRARTYIVDAALLLLLYLMLRILKYRVAVEPVVMRYLVYAYWIPQMLVPALFLMVCIRIRYGDSERARLRDLFLLLLAFILSAVVMTSDLHALVYVPQVDLSRFALDTGTYSHGPVFYLLYVWMIFAIGTGLILLIRRSGRIPKSAVRHLLAVVLLWFGLLALTFFVFDRIPNGFRVFNVPEIHTFGLLGLFEVCVRHRLIPYNENYVGFFRTIRIPVLITDRKFDPVYSTGTPLEADKDELKSSLDGPAELPGNRKLFGREIRAGYAFWTEDESAVRRMRDMLMDANEIIDRENELIRAETELKKEEAYLQSQQRIDYEIAAALYPVQKRIERLLAGAEPGTDGFRDAVATACILNVYVKRKSGLLLLASETEDPGLKALLSAMEESAIYLTLAGMQTTIRTEEDKPLAADRVLLLYDAFEIIAEQFVGTAPSMMVSRHGNGLRFAVEADSLPDPARLPCPADVRRSEGILFIQIPAQGEEGDAV